MKIDVQQAVEFLRLNDDYMVLMHASPDGDTLGCGHALCGALQRMGKRAKAVCPEEIPRKFGYLLEAVKQQDFEPKTVVCVDVADTSLLGDMKEIGDRAQLCIDHHESCKEFAERSLVRPEYAAACELVYEIIDALGVPVDKELANCLYTGMATDTGCFKFSNTTPQTHLYAAQMMKLGAEFARINFIHFELKTQGRIKLEQEVLNKIRYFEGGRVAVITVPLSLVNSLPDVDSDDVGALSNIPRQIEGVDVGICIKEKKPGFYKISVRTDALLNAAKICETFGGGGHERAGGCAIEGTIEDVLDKIVKVSCEAVRKALEK